MSVEWSRAALARASFAATGAQPTLARSTLTSRTTSASAAAMGSDGEGGGLVGAGDGGVVGSGEADVLGSGAGVDRIWILSRSGAQPVGLENRRVFAPAASVTVTATAPGLV